MRLFSVMVILLGFLLIGFGRYSIRRSRAAEGQRRRGRAKGWILTLAGYLAVMIGVVIW